MQTRELSGASAAQALQQLQAQFSHTLNDFLQENTGLAQSRYSSSPGGGLFVK